MTEMEPQTLRTRASVEGARTGGDRRVGIALGRAAVAMGVDALFAEVHPEPARAQSDADVQLPLGAFASILDGWIRIDRAQDALIAFGGEARGASVTGPPMRDHRGR